MIKSLFDASLADALPRILREQPWVKALSLAVAELHKQTMGFIDASQIYTAIDTVGEDVLDALAVSWKIDWYDTEYSVEQKRRIVKTALNIRRTMGTVGAVKSQADAIYPGSTIEEWFEYSGAPGMFRMNVDVTASGQGQSVEIQSAQEIERRLATAKRFSSHLESISYQVLHGVKVGAAMVVWKVNPALCGQPRCGTVHRVKTLGWSSGVEIIGGGKAEAFGAVPGESGDNRCGTMP